MTVFCGQKWELAQVSQCLWSSLGESSRSPFQVFVFDMWQCCSQGPVAELRTLAAAPALQPPPRSVSLTSRSVLMEWDEPLAPNGIIERCVGNSPAYFHWAGVDGVEGHNNPNSCHGLPAVSCI